MNMKIVKEILYEKFTDKSDPIQDMGIGMMHKIIKWLDEYNIRNYYIRKNLTITVKGSVNLSRKDILTLPTYIKFSIVYGNFICSENITSMKGFPKHIKGDFMCSFNKLTSLSYMPKFIDGHCYLGHFDKRDIANKCKVGRHIITY
jgi:hypothetical protein